MPLWVKKKIFYSVLTESDTDKRKLLFQKAKQQGLQFSELTERVIATSRLSMLDGIENVDEWDADFIHKRSRRLASLAWDKLSPWLGINHKII